MVIYIYFVLTGFFLFLKNTSLFFGESESLAGIFRELTLLTLIGTMVCVIYLSKKKKIKCYLSVWNVSYLFVLIIGVSSLLYKMLEGGNYGQLFSLKNYIYDVLFNLLLAMLLVNYYSKVKFYKSLYYFALFLAVGAILQKFVLSSYIDLSEVYRTTVFYTRISFIANNPNHLAFLLTIGIAANNKKDTSALVGCLVLTFACFLTGSRLFSLICLLFLFFKVWSMRHIVVYVLGLLLPFLVWVMFGSFNLTALDRIAGSVANSGNDPRYALWSEAINYSADNIFLVLFGNGFGYIGRYLGVKNELDIPVFYNNEIYVNTITYLDNTFVSLYMDVGLVGLLVFLFMLTVNLFFVNVKGSRVRTCDLGVQLIIILSSFFGDSFFSFPVLLIYLVSIFKQESYFRELRYNER
ncbi:hypothetical protein AKG98_2305 [Moritella sp. JT01]|uniref:O-antigen ligase family protein n=1 Tax=Moritella sp. JT01 TaxID=756698 RepID=UPI00079AB6E5|nr:O-antigen ligase family protein [Moritella sp. JT01]KXO13733.1 hypothetical protein AKG98_2305 [Moritella sp. JT01]